MRIDEPISAVMSALAERAASDSKARAVKLENKQSEVSLERIKPAEPDELLGQKPRDPAEVKAEQEQKDKTAEIVGGLEAQQGINAQACKGQARKDSLTVDTAEIVGGLAGLVEVARVDRAREIHSVHVDMDKAGEPGEYIEVVIEGEAREYLVPLDLMQNRQVININKQTTRTLSVFVRTSKVKSAVAWVSVSHSPLRIEQERGTWLYEEMGRNDLERGHNFIDLNGAIDYYADKVRTYVQAGYVEGVRDCERLVLWLEELQNRRLDSVFISALAEMVVDKVGYRSEREKEARKRELERVYTDSLKDARRPRYAGYKNRQERW